MKQLSVIAFIISLAGNLCAQNTITTDGNWNNPAIWTSGNVADNISEDVFLNNNVDVNIGSPDSFTVGNVSSGSNTSMLISSGATLTLGSPSNPRDFTSNINMSIFVAGNLIIYGNVNVNDNLIISITGAGMVTIIGNLVMSNNASITVNGNLTIGGNFVGGTNTLVSVNGTVNVAGSTTLGTGSSLSGTGSFVTGGPCTGPPAFCSNPILPVELIFFKAMASGLQNLIRWATATEFQSDYYAIEKSFDGLTFFEIARKQAKGESKTVTAYEHVDSEIKGTRQYYRLRMVDLDGTFAFSDVTLVSRNPQHAEVAISPNPARQGEFVNIEIQQAEAPAVIFVRDLHGRQVVRLETKETRVQLPVEWSPGVYLISVFTGGRQTVSRLLVP